MAESSSSSSAPSTEPEKKITEATPSAAPSDVKRYEISFFRSSEPKPEEAGKEVHDDERMKEILALVDTPVRIRGFLHIKRETKKMTFFVIRQGDDTFQVAFQNKGREEWKSFSLESYLEVVGKLQKAMNPIKACTAQLFEMFNPDIVLLSSAQQPLPIQINQLFGGDNIEKGPDGKPKNAPDLSTALMFRSLDLRTRNNRCIFRVKSMVERLFREYMYKNNFIEIHTPKICPGSSEGGANLFEMNFYGDKATLAQSPQLYKQMCICGGMERVFEVAPAFRAEKANTVRHLCEFISMDFEMEIDHFEELPIFTLGVFTYIFDGLKERCKEEIEVLRETYPVQDLKYQNKPVLIYFEDACKMLNEGKEVPVQDPMEDIGTEQEKALGKLVKEKFDTDIYCLVGFPLSARPFYTEPDPKRPGYSLSFDVELRGDEIVSGAQRINSATRLEERGKALGIAIAKDYLDAFKYGAPPHGGIGIGLERVTEFFLGLSNIKESALFPRFYGCKL